MREILVARHAGFCYGVRRAVQQTESVAAAAGGRRVVTLGPLVHNVQEVERLRAAGVEAVSEDRVQEGDLVVVRSHGLELDVLERLRGRAGVKVHDATCPYVRSCQTLARRMAAAGYGIILVGDPGHAETRSVLSFALDAAARHERSPPALVVPAATALFGQAELERVRRVAVLAQTTMSRARFKEVVAACLDRFVEVRALDTICAATERRQAEAMELARSAEVVIVVGGRQSANTSRLVELCRTVQARTHQVEEAGEILPEWLAGAGRIAVTAGASTPARVTLQVVWRCQEIR